MYGIEYITASSYNLLVVVIALVVMIIGSVTDFQKREVADWINYGLLVSAIALRLLFSAITLDPYIILEGFVGFVIFAGIGFSMFYLGQWGGGDTKMIMGLGILFGLKVVPFDLFAVSESLIVAFIINSMICGSIYGLIYAIFIILRNRKKFIENWKRISRTSLGYRVLFFIFGIVMILVGVFSAEFKLLLIPLGIMAILMYYSFVFTKSIEKGCMVKMLSPKEVTEGDWIDSEVNVNGKYVCGPKDLGISKKQIAMLKRLKVKKVPVKIGIPFVPSFLFGFIVTLLFGNIVIVLLRFFIGKF